jgi:hypothetical protein
VMGGCMSPDASRLPEIVINAQIKPDGPRDVFPVVCCTSGYQSTHT